MLHDWIRHARTRSHRPSPRSEAQREGLIEGSGYKGLKRKDIWRDQGRDRPKSPLSNLTLYATKRQISAPNTGKRPKPRGRE